MDSKLLPSAVYFQRQILERNMDHLDRLLKKRNSSSWSWLARGAAGVGRFVSYQQLCVSGEEVLVRVIQLLFCLPL